MRKPAFVGIMVVTAVVAVFVPQAQAAAGSFHVRCTFSHALGDDPIVHPGQPGVSHLHDFFGNVSTDASSTLASMRSASTLCQVPGDTSGYWSPALVAPDGTVVTPEYLTVYYWGKGTVVEPPADLRVIAGGDTGNLKVAGYTCGGSHATVQVPGACGSLWLKGVIVFPSCWDGVRADSPDHRSHMAYPTGKGCPSGFPVRIPKIVFHINYGIHDGTGYTLMSDSGMGMSDGRSLHADFWNAWDQAALQQAVASCLNAGVTCDF